MINPNSYKGKVRSIYNVKIKLHFALKKKYGSYKRMPAEELEQYISKIGELPPEITDKGIDNTIWFINQFFPGSYDIP